MMQLGLIGYPIQHSRSPWIHQAFMKQIKLDGKYQLFQIEPDQFDQGIRQLQTLDLDGFNVTIPFKQRIIDYLDQIDHFAEAIGAVNTVVCEKGKWIGYNTDGLGYVLGIRSSYPDLFAGNKQVLLLGAGGASRGIYYALLQENFDRIDIANRTTARAQELLSINTSNLSSDVMTYQEAAQQLNQYDLIINTTSVGMQPNLDKQVIALDGIKQNTVVSDIVYQPFWTALLKDAKQKGARVHHGHEMLLYQGKIAFEKWTGHRIDAEKIMPNFLNSILAET